MTFHLTPKPVEFKRARLPILFAHPFLSLFSNRVFSTGNSTRPYAESIRASRAWIATGLPGPCAASGSTVRDQVRTIRYK